MIKPFDKTEWPLGWMSPVNWHKAEFINAFHNWREKWGQQIILDMALAQKIRDKHKELQEERDSYTPSQVAMSGPGAFSDLELLDEILAVREDENNES